MLPLWPSQLIPEAGPGLPVGTGGWLPCIESLWQSQQQVLGQLRGHGQFSQDLIIQNLPVQVLLKDLENLLMVGAVQLLDEEEELPPLGLGQVFTLLSVLVHRPQ